MNRSQPHLPSANRPIAPASAHRTPSRRASVLLAGSSAQHIKHDAVFSVRILIKEHQKAVRETEAATEARHAIEAELPSYDDGILLPGEQWAKALKLHPDFKATVDRQARAFKAEEKALEALLKAAPKVAAHARTFSIIAKYVCKLEAQANGRPFEGADPAYRCLAALAGLRITLKRH